MNRKNLIITLGTLMLIGGIAFLYVGCEDGPSTSELDNYFANNPYSSLQRPGSDSSSAMSITPSSATCDFIGQQINFRVAGGDGGYRWGVAQAGPGSITQNTDEQGVYTVGSLDDNTIIVYDSRNRVVTARISPTASAALQLIPSSLKTGVGSVNIFDIVGGTAPYGGQLNNAALGTLVTNGSQMVFNASGTGTNGVLTVFDDTGATTTAAITTE